MDLTKIFLNVFCKLILHMGAGQRPAPTLSDERSESEDEANSRPGRGFILRCEAVDLIRNGGYAGEKNLQKYFSQVHADS